ncbi:MAG: PucR family transcriptional regulator [Actinophytocola sp.]|nr:PucR family transcriptional regulator [Actinophytocola sp.]
MAFAEVAASDSGVTRYNEDTRHWESLRREFIDDLLGGHGIGHLADRAERFGTTLSGVQVVAAVRAPEVFVDGGVVYRRVESELGQVLGRRDVLVCTKDGLLVCLAPASIIDEFVDAVTAVLGAGTPWRMGIGPAQSGPDGAARSFELACNALDIGERLDLPDQVLRDRDLLVYRVLRRDSAALSELVTDVLEPLRATRIGPGPLLETLIAYFMAGGVATAAAQRLGVSVRTVTYRLKRVGELTGYALDNPEEAFTLQVAALGARLIGWLDRGGAT